MKATITIIAALLITLAAHSTAAAAHSESTSPVDAPAAMVVDMESTSNLPDVIAGVSYLLVAIGCGYLFFHIIGDDKKYKVSAPGHAEQQHS